MDLKAKFCRGSWSFSSHFTPQVFKCRENKIKSFSLREWRDENIIYIKF